MGRPRPPDDRLPSDAPAYDEEGAVRWELPVVINGARGVLVIRCFDDDYPVKKRKHEGVSVRGLAVTQLDAAREESPMSEIVQCDRCDAKDSLEPYGRPDPSGAQWHFCTVCSTTLLLAADGRIILHGTDRVRVPTFVGGGAAEPS